MLVPLRCVLGGVAISESNLREIYEGIEQTILSKSQNKTEAKNLLSCLNQRMVLEEDQDYFRALVTAIFHGSGIKAVQLEPVLYEMFKNSVFCDYRKVLKLTEKQQRALCQLDGIGYKQSLDRVFKSTKMFEEKIKQHGSFLNYMNAHEDVALYKDLKKNFHGLGKISTYHFLKECGHPHMKPDSVIGRSFSRLGLIDDIDNIGEIIRVGDQIARITGHTHQRIDLVLVKFGAEGASDLFNLVDGICREKNPDCGSCLIKQHCSFTNE